ncbi:hypothetical protein BELL_1251g00020 [Botrytis elliptica]|uniref:Uncharacterized protein n=1 Tax=Botrytis elliptica TaxID=278938 RepID=A0A4Z1ID16_9HELO|nr:hypothetical protein EAE99_009469 [Botrytis elliptica]TGO59326.1 hypothetical protein BELL_1251g00020 [Botrytis elliptica]
MRPFSVLALASLASAAVVDVTKGAKVEAETGILNGVTVGNNPGGFSGSGFVQGFDAASDSVTITLQSNIKLNLFNIQFKIPLILK